METQQHTGERESRARTVPESRANHLLEAVRIPRLGRMMNNSNWPARLVVTSLFVSPRSKLSVPRSSRILAFKRTLAAAVSPTAAASPASPRENPQREKRPPRSLPRLLAASPHYPRRLHPSLWSDILFWPIRARRRNCSKFENLTARRTMLAPESGSHPRRALLQARVTAKNRIDWYMSNNWQRTPANELGNCEVERERWLRCLP
jgi:hypothetical protein